MAIEIAIDGDRARITSLPSDIEKEVLLPPDVILGNSIWSPHLLQDFGANRTETKRYKELNILDGEIQETTVTKKGTEILKISGKEYTAYVFDTLNYTIGLKTTVWIDTESGYLLKAELPTRTITLAGRSVRSELKRVNVDDDIIAKVGVNISDIRAISSMTVNSSLDPIGTWITPDNLNVPGQIFEGTVENNVIDGVFKISHKRYDGNNAPPFPPDFSREKTLKPYLEPEDLIESKDPVLIQKAEELTEGSRDSWEATKRLSGWVAEEIGYDIPGGGSARNTYDLRAGECGAHSKLFAAFCRAVGIPARVVWGCMYIPNLGGAFGQHAWNEVYMGEAGWVTLDTTIREIDYVDSGHIRLGELSSKQIAWNPKKLEILDFEAGAQKFGVVPEAGSLAEYEPFIGKYRGPENILTILVQNRSLALDIPGRMIFELREPDEEGIWYFKLTKDAGVSFQQDITGRVTAMTIHNSARLPKKQTDGDIPKNVPEEYRPYIGKYPIPMERAHLTVIYKNNTLAMQGPEPGTLYLEGPDEEGIWIDKQGNRKFSFIKDESGTVRAMVFHEIVHCPKEDS
jgi:transglutaminase-like putative cysteine protease